MRDGSCRGVNVGIGRNVVKRLIPCDRIVIFVVIGLCGKRFRSCRTAVSHGLADADLLPVKAEETDGIRSGDVGIQCGISRRTGDSRGFRIPAGKGIHLIHRLITARGPFRRRGHGAVVHRCGGIPDPVVGIVGPCNCIAAQLRRVRRGINGSVVIIAHHKVGNGGRPDAVDIIILRGGFLGGYCGNGDRIAVIAGNRSIFGAVFIIERNGAGLFY